MNRDQNDYRNRSDHGTERVIRNMQAVTFGEFSRLANKRHWMPEFLAKRFRGQIEEASQFFHRVFETKNASALIPYRSVIVFYLQALGVNQTTLNQDKLCACGCGQAVFDRKKWAGSACKKRTQRNAALKAA